MSLWNTLDKLKNGTWVELSHPLTNESPYWGGMPDGVVDLCNTVFDYDEEILSCRIQTYKFPGQFGTHVDFPSHFTAGKVGSEAFGPDYMALPLCVIDLTPKIAAEGPDVAVTVEDIEAWEAENGCIPEGALWRCAPTGRIAGPITTRSTTSMRTAASIAPAGRSRPSSFSTTSATSR